MLEFSTLLFLVHLPVMRLDAVFSKKIDNTSTASDLPNRLLSAWDTAIKANGSVQTSVLEMMYKK